MTVESPFAALLDELPITHDVVSVLGSDTHYWVYGPEDAATTIVVAHGYRGEHHGLEPVIAHIRGIRIVSPDLPAFGDSSPLVDVGHDIPGYAAWLAGFMDALDLSGSAIVLGHSFGSIITSYGISRGVIQTPRLILVNPIAAPATSGPFGFLTYATMGFYRVSMAMPEKVGRFFLDNWLVIRFMSVSLAKTKDRSLRRWIHDQHHQYFGRFATRKTVVDGFTASVSMDISDVAGGIAIPTLLIGAEKDLITPAPALHKLQEQLADATLHVIPGVGHLIHYEKARIAAEFIVDFVGDGSVATDPITP